MTTIHKYQIDITDSQTIPIPLGGKIIHAGLDPRGTPCLWAVVDTQSPKAPIFVYVVGTGNPMPLHDVQHVGTINHGPFMWHVFIDKP